MKIIIFFLIFIFKFNFLYSNDSSSFANKIFKELDMDKNGVVDKKDVENFSKKDFDLMDKDKDNKLSKEEFFSFVCQKTCEVGNNCDCNYFENKESLYYFSDYWIRLDTNNDNYISREEKLSDDLNNFYNLDLQGKGKITKEDIEAQFY